MISNIYVGNIETTIDLGQRGTVGLNRSNSDQILRQEQISSKIHLAIREMLNTKQEQSKLDPKVGSYEISTQLCPTMSSRIGHAICSLHRDLKPTS